MFLIFLNFQLNLIGGNAYIKDWFFVIKLRNKFALYLKIMSVRADATFFEAFFQKKINYLNTVTANSNNYLRNKQM